MAEKIITGSHRLDAANTFIDLISNTENRYYLFTSKHTPYASSDSVVEAPEDTEAYINSLYRNMIFGKRISANDVMLVTTRHDWEANTVFTQFDSEDAELSTKAFYAVVNADATYHVYKCLYNNGGVPSTIQPDFSLVSVDDSSFETSDGYVWKYMYSVDDSIVDRFASDDHFPVVPNTDVSEAAVSGSIDVIAVTGRGNNYNNYLAGNNQFSTLDLRIGGNNLLYNISGNVSAASSNDYYNGCYIYIRSGAPGEAGQYRKIVDYQVNSTSKAIVLESAFTNAISISSKFDIYPGVVVVGDGSQTINAAARAIVNATGNVIHRIEMLNNGAGYRSANATVYAYGDVGATDAELRVIYSPHGGHGYNAANELFANTVVVSVTLGDTESNTIVAENEYRTIGVLKDPLFANVHISASSLDGAFINGEEVYKIEPLYLGNTMTTNSASSVVTVTNGRLTEQFEAGDELYVVANTSHMIATVNSVTNSTSMILTSNASFTASNCQFYLPRSSTEAYVISSNTTSVTLRSVDGTLGTGDTLVGHSSGAMAVVNAISISSVTKGFETFIGMYKYVGSIVSGEFDEDETIYQVSIDSANATLHSVVSNNTFYTTNSFGPFAVDTNIVGADSEAVANIVEIYEPEIEFRSGDVLYVESMEPVPRAEGQSETFKLIYSF